MKIKRAASIPLIVSDPYFSIWSPADALYETDTAHWSGIRQKIRGYVTVDGTVYCFMGDKEFHQAIEQKSLDVTATATEYDFENDKISLKARFCSPLLLEDFTLVSRPCTYIDLEVSKKTACKVQTDFMVYSDLVQRGDDELIGGSNCKSGKQERASFQYAFMGRAAQQPLGNSGDNITIDWGYGYLASDDEKAVLTYDAANRFLGCHMCFEQTQERKGMIAAYDDLLSINYFGEWRKAYWTKAYTDILDAIGAAFFDKEEVLGRAKVLDEDIYRRAAGFGGEEYAFLCCLSYRHSIAGHKLITDEKGEIIFLSKENDSNGCIGTVDVSYPSVPLFLLYQTEYVKGMMRPVFRFAACDVWEYDFAPHDVGRYPYAWGQVYGLNRDNRRGDFSGENGKIFPPFYMYPGRSDVYNFSQQMPVEECGNMLIMSAAVCLIEGSGDFVAPHREILKGWTKYLIEFGADPGEQLCTDDFAGHLSHNVNLSAKAVMGIEAYAKLAALWGDEEEAQEYHGIAAAMAADWEKRAKASDHYMLVFDGPDTWSLKYNLVWDRFFGSGLFSEEVYDKELAYYIDRINEYGTPLDSRKDYTKSDWILWCAAMAEDRDQAKKLIAPVAHYLETTTTRYPFGDWYETVTGEYCHFKGRSVQGGIFMPLLMESARFSL